MKPGRLPPPEPPKPPPKGLPPDILIIRPDGKATFCRKREGYEFLLLIDPSPDAEEPFIELDSMGNPKEPE